MMPPDLQEILIRIRKGDPAAFRKLVEMYRQQAFRLAFRILANEEEAREAVQETFIRIWERIGSYDPSREFTPWLNRILVNISVDHLRMIQRYPQVSVNEATNALEKLATPDPLVNTENQDIARLIRFLAEGLPAKQRLVFILRDIEGMTSGEVEVLTMLSEESVKSNLYYARKRLKENLNKILENERSIKWS
jgi:RNA polymerase sigma-70 factor, ECF subfamily